MKIKFIFSIFILLISTLSAADNRPGFVCGRFNDTVIEVPSSYLYSFAEYEGYSYFDSRFLENKKGCDANFRVLPLVMSWPDMKPFDRNENGENKKIRFSIEPLDGDPKGYLEYKRYLYLDSGEGKYKGSISYNEELELYFNEVIFRFNNKYHDFKEYKRGYYWGGDKESINILFDCAWIPDDGVYSRCDAIYLIPEIGFKIKVLINYKDLNMWNEIVGDVNKFIYKYMKL
ncbi:hypothetical protein [Providencia alcalifaciens]|uniref:hypothetical protein n=1 Tax=Providencia alcalifaciens TaxID=126385 RepID=UPI003D957E6B